MDRNDSSEYVSFPGRLARTGRERRAVMSCILSYLQRDSCGGLETDEGAARRQGC